MLMTGKRRKITAAVVVFFVLFSALFLSVRPENSGYAAGSPPEPSVKQKFLSVHPTPPRRKVPQRPFPDS